LLTVALQYLDETAFARIVDTDIGRWNCLHKVLIPIAMKHPKIYLKLLGRAMHDE